MRPIPFGLKFGHWQAELSAQVSKLSQGNEVKVEMGIKKAAHTYRTITNDNLCGRKTE